MNTYSHIDIPLPLAVGHGGRYNNSSLEVLDQAESPCEKPERVIVAMVSALCPSERTMIAIHLRTLKTKTFGVQTTAEELIQKTQFRILNYKQVSKQKGVFIRNAFPSKIARIRHKRYTGYSRIYHLTHMQTCSLSIQNRI